MLREIAQNSRNDSYIGVTRRRRDSSLWNYLVRDCVEYLETETEISKEVIVDFMLDFRPPMFKEEFQDLVLPSYEYTIKDLLTVRFTEDYEINEEDEKNYRLFFKTFEEVYLTDKEEFADFIKKIEYIRSQEEVAYSFIGLIPESLVDNFFSPFSMIDVRLEDDEGFLDSRLTPHKILRKNEECLNLLRLSIFYRLFKMLDLEDELDKLSKKFLFWITDEPIALTAKAGELGLNNKDIVRYASFIEDLGLDATIERMEELNQAPTDDENTDNQTQEATELTENPLTDFINLQDVSGITMHTTGELPFVPASRHFLHRRFLEEQQDETQRMTNNTSPVWGQLGEVTFPLGEPVFSQRVRLAQEHLGNFEADDSLDEHTITFTSALEDIEERIRQSSTGTIVKED